MPFEPYHVDPDDPRAPPQEIWDALSPEERQRICDSLPSKFTIAERVEASRVKLVQQLAEESRLRAEETQRREDAERRLAELERLRGERA
ncbi:hypothetical protein [Myxococcus sp. Y35]|uniref:hypothetical protein n=1 Tax=Pseudomyxococcus flavus TaxID=3115648 RepID=UPI003CF566ED